MRYQVRKQARVRWSMDHLAVGFFHFLLSTEPSQLSRDITRKSNTTLHSNSVRSAIAHARPGSSEISFCRLRHILFSKMKDRQNDGRKGVIFRGDVLQNIFLYTSQEEFFAVKSSSHLSLKTNNPWKTNQGYSGTGRRSNIVMTIP